MFEVIVSNIALYNALVTKVPLDNLKLDSDNVSQIDCIRVISDIRYVEFTEEKEHIDTFVNVNVPPNVYEIHKLIGGNQSIEEFLHNHHELLIFLPHVEQAYQLVQSINGNITKKKFIYDYLIYENHSLSEYFVTKEDGVKILDRIIEKTYYESFHNSVNKDLLDIIEGLKNNTLKTSYF